MPKAGELAYLSKLGDAGALHSLHKPFSDASCAVNLVSIGTVMSLLPHPPASVLDLGCGGGWTSLFLARRGYDVVGQDIAPDMIRLAQQNREMNGITEGLDFLCSDFESLDFENRFDAALFFDCLHHAEDEALAIRSVYRALKPGGMLITHEPGDGHATNPQALAAVEQFDVTERDMPPRLILRRGREAGFTRFRVLPMPEDLLKMFYGDRAGQHRLTRGQPWRHLRKVWQMLFNPDLGASSIVIMTK